MSFVLLCPTFYFSIFIYIFQKISVNNRKDGGGIRLSLMRVEGYVVLYNLCKLLEMNGLGYHLLFNLEEQRNSPMDQTSGLS